MSASRKETRSPRPEASTLSSKGAGLPGTSRDGEESFMLPGLMQTE